MFRRRSDVRRIEADRAAGTLVVEARAFLSRSVRRGTFRLEDLSRIALEMSKDEYWDLPGSPLAMRIEEKDGTKTLLDFKVLELDTAEEARDLFFRFATIAGISTWSEKQEESGRLKLDAPPSPSQPPQIVPPVTAPASLQCSAKEAPPDLPSFDPKEQAGGFRVERWEVGRLVRLLETSKKDARGCVSLALVVCVACTAWLCYLAATSSSLLAIAFGSFAAIPLGFVAYLLYALFAFRVVWLEMDWGAREVRLGGGTHRVATRIPFSDVTEVEARRFVRKSSIKGAPAPERQRCVLVLLRKERDGGSVATFQLFDAGWAQKQDDSWRRLLSPGIELARCLGVPCRVRDMA